MSIRDGYAQEITSKTAFFIAVLFNISNDHQRYAEAYELILRGLGIIFGSCFGTGGLLGRRAGFFGSRLAGPQRPKA